MPLTVRPLEEADIESSLRVQYAAFRIPGLGTLLSPNPEPSPEFIAGSTQSRLETMRTNTAARFMVVEDTDTNFVIAGAHWDLFRTERTAQQVDELCHKSAPPPEANAAAWTAFFGHFAESRRKLGTKPIAILHTLVTDPKHQKRGAGKLLMQKFVEDIDKVGLEAYLEASEIGRPLYVKFGFQPIFEKRFDLSNYGAEGIELNTVMLRPAKASA
jgi:GNAT superfamily N-acetyltransferase